jgi:hypothetical protein
MENYLEGEAYFSTYFWTQIICSMVMVAVNILEMRRFFDSFEILTIVNPDVKKTTFLELFVISTMLFQYFFIPLLLGMVSLLLLLESGSVVDVIKDTLSLLFLNEINNYLQVRNTPEARKWKIMLKQEKIDVNARVKSIFTTILFISYAVVIWIASQLVYTGGGSFFTLKRVHPSILFNNLRRTPGEESQGVAFFLAFYLSFAAALVFTLIVLSCLKKFEKVFKRFWVEVPAGGISEPKTCGSRVCGWFFRNMYVPLQDFVGAVFYRRHDIHDAKPQDEPATVLCLIPQNIFLSLFSLFHSPLSLSHTLLTQLNVQKMQYLTGQMMQVPIHEDIGKVMATRLPGTSASIVISHPGMPTSGPSPIFQPP